MPWWIGVEFIDCFFITEEVTNHLAEVNDVVETLLKHATNDKLSNDVKQNAAICLAKLATSDGRYNRNIVILVMVKFSRRQ